MVHSGMRWGRTGHILESCHLSNVRAWWRGTLVVSACGLEAELGAVLPET